MSEDNKPLTSPSPPIRELQSDIRDGIKKLLEKVHAETLDNLPSVRAARDRTEAFGMELVDLIVKHFGDERFPHPIHAVLLYREIASFLANMQGLAMAGMPDKEKAQAFFTLKSYIDEKQRVEAGEPARPIGDLN